MVKTVCLFAEHTLGAAYRAWGFDLCHNADPL
jgi:hypothetical protein